MREVAATGEEVVVTKRGKPVARVLPPNSGDILSPVGPEPN